VKLYLIGSLENPNVPMVAAQLRDVCSEVFDCWHAAGPKADRHWEEYERSRGHSFQQAVKNYPAQHVFNYDRSHLNRCDGGVLLMPAGKSGHLELGYMQGQGKPTWILFQEEPQRWDVMLAGATICMSMEELLESVASAQQGISYPACIWP